MAGRGVLVLLLALSGTVVFRGIHPFLAESDESELPVFVVEGWIADYADSQNFLDVLFHSESTQNHSGYGDAAVDALLLKARVERDAAVRRDLYREAERLIVDAAPWIPLTHGIGHVLVKPQVRGYYPSAGLYPWLKTVSIGS